MIASLLARLLCRLRGHDFARARQGVKQCKNCPHSEPAQIRKRKLPVTPE